MRRDFKKNICFLLSFAFLQNFKQFKNSRGCVAFGLVVLCLLALGLSGCGVIPKADYPIGIYSVGSATNLTDVAAAGFNLVTGPARRDFLDAAQTNGLRVLASPGSHAGPKFDAAEVRSRGRAAPTAPPRPLG